jgi:hypothetical protein
MAFEFSNNLTDANYITTKALHTTEALSDSFDLETIVGGDIQDIVVEIKSPASVATTGKICTYVLQDSADDSAFANIDPLTSTTITAADSALAAKTIRFRMTPNTRRYIRVKQTGDTLGSVAGSYTFSLLF